MTIDSGLRDLERRLPANLRGPVRDFRANLRALQRQVDKARKDREERWRKLEQQIRKDAAQALRRLERAIAGPTARKKSSSRKKKASAGRKSAAKKSTRRKATRKKASRKKTARR